METFLLFLGSVVAAILTAVVEALLRRLRVAERRAYADS